MSTTTGLGGRLTDGRGPLTTNRNAADLSLSQCLGSAWTSGTLASLLHAGDAQVVERAATCLGLVGTMRDTPKLARLLHDDNADVAAAGEDALWSIWFRAGSVRANTLVADAVEAMNDEAYGKAVRLLADAIADSPDFAEAYNQRALAWLLDEKPLPSVADARRALSLNRWHFGAAASLGHAYAQLGLFERCLEAYAQAIKLHPRLEGVRQSIRQVRGIVSDSSHRLDC